MIIKVLYKVKGPMYMYYLDSDICINLMRNKLPLFAEMLKNSCPELIGIPAIVEAELRRGAYKSAYRTKNTIILDDFLRPYDIVPFCSKCANAFGRISKFLESRGKKIGPNDTLIAATALANGATLVTNNEREFKRVPGLSLEVWSEVDWED